MLANLISDFITFCLLSLVSQFEAHARVLLDFMGEFVEPKGVFFAFPVDQGQSVVNACEALGVDVIKYNCHRVNPAVLWSLGISGSAARCKNKAMGELMKKLAVCVGFLSHSAVNDMLKELQKLEEDLHHRIDELIRRNNTR